MLCVLCPIIGVYPVSPTGGFCRTSTSSSIWPGSSFDELDARDSHLGSSLAFSIMTQASVILDDSLEQLSHEAAATTTWTKPQRLERHYCILDETDIAVALVLLDMLEHDNLRAQIDLAAITSPGYGHVLKSVRTWLIVSHFS